MSLLGIKPSLIYSCSWNKVQMLLTELTPRLVCFPYSACLSSPGDTEALLPGVSLSECFFYLECRSFVPHTLLESPDQSFALGTLPERPSNASSLSITLSKSSACVQGSCSVLQLNVCLCPHLIHGSPILLKALRVYPQHSQPMAFCPEKNSVFIINIYGVNKRMSGG